MKKITILICLILIMCMAVSSCSPATAPEVTATAAAGTTTAGNVETSPVSTEPLDTVYIGALIGLTGTTATVYPGQAIELAKEEINASGGILGHPLEIKYFDLVNTTETAVSAFKLALEDKDVIALINNSTSTNTLACMQYIQDGKIPVVGSQSSDLLGKEQNPYYWQILTFNSYSVVGLGKYVVEECKLTNPAVWYTTTQACVEKKDIMLDYLETQGISVSESMIFGTAKDEKNYAPVAAQIKASGADALIALGDPGCVGYLAKAVQDAGIELPSFADGGPVYNSDRKIAGDAFEGWYSSARAVPNDPREVAQSFFKNYMEKYGDNEIVTLDVSSMYDAVYFVKTACEIADTVTDREKINEAFSQFKNVERVMGVMSYHDDHNFRDTTFIVQINGSEIELAKVIQYR